MASAELGRRVGKVVGYPPLCEMGELSGGARRRARPEQRLDLDGLQEADPPAVLPGGRPF